MTRRERELRRTLGKLAIWVVAVSVAGSAAVAGIIVVTQPEHGRVNVGPDTVQYIPDPGYVGPDAFTIAHTGVNPTIIHEGESLIEFDGSCNQEFSVPITLIVHEDGTREVHFGAPND
jgi:hypothetical protein